MFCHTNISDFQFQFETETFSNNRLIAEYEAVEREVIENPDDIAATVKLAAYATALRFREKRYFDRY